VRRFLARLVSLVVVFTLLWVVGGRMLADRWTQEADRAWTALGTPMTAFPGRFPKHGPNESARKLDDVAARLGIGMAPPGATGRPQPSADDAKRLETVRGELDSWLDAQLGNPSDRIAAPPENVAAFLAARASGIRYLVAQLRVGEAPVWEQDLDRLTDAPLPFLKGHRALDQVLCAWSLEAQREGRSEDAVEAVEAAARAAVSMQDRPEMVGRLVEIAVLRTQAGTLRKLDGVPATWQARLTERDLRKSMLVSLQAEAWILGTSLGRTFAIPSARSLDGKAAARRPTMTAQVAAFYEKPYALLAAADYSRALARTSGALEDQKACTFEPDAMKAVDERARQEIGRWNVMRLAMPSVAAFWATGDSARFQRELTAKVLELKALRTASRDGAWPRQVPGIESSVCPGNRWTYVVSADGGAVLTASQSPSKAVPAVRYEGAAPPPAKPLATPVKSRSSS
jgi:hypothetical protein